MLILLTNDILVIMPIPSVRTNLVDNPSPFILGCNMLAIKRLSL